MYLFLFFFISIFLSFILNKIALKYDFVDIPDHRKIHKKEIPLVGGFVLFIMISLFFFLNFQNIDNYLKLIYFASIAIFLIGFLDDRFRVSAYLKLLIQFFSTCILVYFDFKIINFVNIQSVDNFLINFSIILTFISILGLTNAFNFIDGIDGLCSSIFCTSIFSIILLLLFMGENINNLNILLYFLIIVIAFIFVNLNVFKFGKAFLGDSGSLLLGFYISSFLIYYSNFSTVKIEPLLVFWCVTLIVFDFFAVFLNRIRAGANPFYPDNTHIHHLLLKLGYSQKKTLFLLLLASILLNLFGIFTSFIYGVTTSTIIFFILFFIYYFVNYKLTNLTNNSLKP